MRRETSAAPAPPAQVAERRLVSVLFADLVGFTTISESRDAEDVRELLDSYFGMCREIVGRYGGTIEKFIGDAVMAVWGTPIAQEDDAERAVRAALDLVDAVRRLGEGAEVPTWRCGPASSPARRRSPWGPATWAWSPATSSTPPPGSSRSPKPGPCWSATRRGEHRERQSPTSPSRTRCSRARSCRSGPGARCASSPSAAGPDGATSSRRRSSAATPSCS